MRSNAIQFRGEEQVLKAFEMNGMPNWSIWSGQNMIFVGEEDDMNANTDLLVQAINMLKEGRSEACYQLRVYKKVPNEGLKTNTPADRSFQFSVFDSGAVGSPFQQRQSSMMGLIDQKFQELQVGVLERVFDKLDREDEEEEEDKKKGPGGVMGMINGLLENPEIKAVLMSKVAEVAGRWLGTSPSVGAIGALPPTAQPLALELDQDQLNKVNEAMVILTAHDKKIGDHLLKLAALARDNPMKYKMGLTML